MKSLHQSTKSMSSTSNVKSKKGSKDREKRKSQNSQSENNSNDKGSPAKDCKQYAGIGPESICSYVEQSAYEHLSDEVCNTLAEDINYKLRYIIHDSLIKARLSGRDVINSTDIEESFSSLSIEKVYGASSNPNWVPFGDQNLLYLDDTKINLIELAEEENTYAQYASASLTKKWYPDPEQSEPSETLKEYFMVVCQTVISNDEELRQMTLKDISGNCRIGPIIEWFYHYGYFLLMKDVTYDCLTLRALELIETLENSPFGSENVSCKQLKLLVRLLLQRLMLSVTSAEVLKPMCSTLAVLCLREPLKEMAITKINQKLYGLHREMLLPVLTTIYFLGIDAVEAIFIPNINYFLENVKQSELPEISYMTLGIYSHICRAEHNNVHVHNCFYEVFGSRLVMFWRPFKFQLPDLPKLEMNFVVMKTQLVKTRRKVDCNIKKRLSRPSVDDVFELPTYNCRVKRKIEEHHMGLKKYKKETHVIVGKTSLLLSILKGNKTNLSPKCMNHCLLTYNL